MWQIVKVEKQIKVKQLTFNYEIEGPEVQELCRIQWT